MSEILDSATLYELLRQLSDAEMAELMSVIGDEPPECDPAALRAWLEKVSRWFERRRQ